MLILTPAQWTLLLLPLALIPFMIAVFSWAKQRFAPHRAYLMGFLVYWFIGGLLIPSGFLSASDFQRLFTLADQPFGEPALIGAASLLLPITIAPFYVGTFARLRELTLPVAVASLLFALANGTVEELLWRGTYLTVFQDTPLLGYIYPSIAFGLWHFAPQIVEPAQTGTRRFAISAIFLGLAFGWTAFQTGAILPGVIAHILVDMAGLAGLTLVRTSSPDVTSEKASSV